MGFVAAVGDVLGGVLRWCAQILSGSGVVGMAVGKDGGEVLEIGGEIDTALHAALGLYDLFEGDHGWGCDALLFRLRQWHGRRGRFEVHLAEPRHSDPRAVTWPRTVKQRMAP